MITLGLITYILNFLEVYLHKYLFIWIIIFLLTPTNLCFIYLYFITIFKINQVITITFNSINIYQNLVISDKSTYLEHIYILYQ